LVDGLLTARRAAEAELPPLGFESAQGKLRVAMEKTFEPSLEEVGRLAETARGSLHVSARIDDAGRILAADGTPIGVKDALRALATNRPRENWDEMCHEVAALASILRAIEDHGAQHGAETAAFRERLKRVARGLRFGEVGREWPVVLGSRATNVPMASAVTTMEEARRELDAIRGELMGVNSATIGER
jgi:hypothetical protein